MVGLKLMHVGRNLAEKHYLEHKDKPFFGSLVAFIGSGPVLVAALEGRSAVEVVRNLIGPTSGIKAPPGTIRGDFALSVQNNLVHASDSLESAKKELELWFQEGELCPAGKGTGVAGRSWVYSEGDLKG